MLISLACLMLVYHRNNLVDSWSGNARVERVWQEKETVMFVWNRMGLLGGGLVVVPNGHVS